MPIAADSLNEGDVFVLDAGAVICVWCGASSNQQVLSSSVFAWMMPVSQEQKKGEQFACTINREERGGNSVVQLFQQGDEPPSFWDALGGETRSLRLF